MGAELEAPPRLRHPVVSEEPDSCSLWRGSRAGAAAPASPQLGKEQGRGGAAFPDGGLGPSSTATPRAGGGRPLGRGGVQGVKTRTLEPEGGHVPGARRGWTG